MTKITCDIVQDVLPLYYDEVCSQDTKKLVEEHLQSCKECQKELENLSAIVPVQQSETKQNAQDKKMMMSLANSWKGFRKKAFFKGIGIASLVSLLLIGSYFTLTEWDIKPVKQDNIVITEIAQLADGRIAFHIDYLDDIDVYRVKYELHEDGNFYMIPLRTIIGKSSLPHFVVSEGYQTFDLPSRQIDRDGKINALFYGSPENAQLIWKEGMALPKASEEQEQHLKIED
ncbi:zf-HC2 domain-containing protein [Solibacillus sp. MA9]|uniref:Anti-sigma-W factor RsiW n=1 Tax=Solibacillus palustris TaxID=2908203 RepID=A0ABS9UFV8_9BACL|nr:zf-HC2 domain-containing protein [Solibacillus sp. MA9]MCH7323238.1 zf-HC2 domain-containing protein [Solibacillus sp. MA9]